MSNITGESYPWLDGGDEVILNDVIDPQALDHPFEIYYYQPFMGYGQIKFIEDGIQLKYPKGQREGGVFYIDWDLDGDGDIDADDLGCLVAILVAMGLGYLFKKLRDKDLERKREIKWSVQIKNQELRDLSLNGRTLDITRNSRKRSLFQVRFAVEDGERLYRELANHYAKLL